MDELILLLFKKNATRAPVAISTTDLGAMLGMSQQNASRRVRELIEGGFITKSEQGLMLTEKSLGEARTELAVLETVLRPKPLQLEGTIVEGLGEGKYYLSLKPYAQGIEKKLGFWPYPGTLNVKLSKDQMEARAKITGREPLVIEGFRTPDRTYGGLFAYPCTIEGVQGALIIPVRTHHGTDVIELVAPVHLREKLKKKTGDSVSVLFEDR